MRADEPSRRAEQALRRLDERRRRAGEQFQLRARERGPRSPGVSVLSTWPEGVLFDEDFERPLAGRWATDDPGQVGDQRWGRSALYSASPTRSITDSPGGTELEPVFYVPDQDNWARTVEAIDLSGARDCRVEATLDVDTQFNSDILHLEATTTPAVESSWQSVATYTGLFTERVAAPLPPELAGGVQLFLRLRMHADSAGVDDGAYVDDVSVVCRGAYNASSYEVHSGTSIAAPHVAGAAALLFAKYPEAGVAEVKEMLLRGVDRQPGLAGRVATGGRLNLYKAAAESTVARTGARLTFTAGAGQVNDVLVTRITDGGDGLVKYRFADRYSTDPAADQGGSRIVPGAGCTRLGEVVVKCDAAGIRRIVLETGQLSDRAVATTIAIPVTLAGGGGPDILGGGSAPDRFVAGYGDDLVRARSGDVDESFDCGENPGDADVVIADASPPDPVGSDPADCERVIGG